MKRKRSQQLPWWWKLAPRTIQGKWLFGLTQRLNGEPGNPSAEADLRELLDSPRARERRFGLNAVVELTKPSDWMWTKALKSLEDPDPFVRLSVIEVVGFDVERASDVALHRCREVAAVLSGELGYRGRPERSAAMLEEAFRAEIDRRDVRATGPHA